MFQRKDNGLWVERVEVGGKRKTITAKTKQALKKKLLAINSLQGKDVTYAIASDAWEEAKANKLAYNTYQAYKPHIARAKEYFNNKPVIDITPAEVQAFIDLLASQGYAKDTVHRALVICHEIFDYAIMMPDSVLRFNPCAAVKVPKGLKKQRREPPAPDQLAKISPDSEMGLFAWFLLYTGLRRGELLALRWEDINREDKLITVNKSIYFDNNKPKVKDTKSEAGNRTVELLNILADVLPDKKTGYVFGGSAPWTSYEFNRKWLEWCKSIGLAEEIRTTHTNPNNKHTYITVKYKPLITCHQFRHEYASMLEDAGITEFNAKTALGHSSITVTKDIYTHIRNRKGARIGDTLNEYLDKQHGAT